MLHIKQTTILSKTIEMARKPTFGANMHQTSEDIGKEQIKSKLFT